MQSKVLIIAIVTICVVLPAIAEALMYKVENKQRCSKEVADEACRKCCPKSYDEAEIVGGVCTCTTKHSKARNIEGDAVFKKDTLFGNGKWKEVEPPLKPYSVRFPPKPEVATPASRKLSELTQQEFDLLYGKKKHVNVHGAGSDNGSGYGVNTAEMMVPVIV